MVDEALAVDAELDGGGGQAGTGELDVDADYEALDWRRRLPLLRRAIKFWKDDFTNPRINKYRVGSEYGEHCSVKDGNVEVLLRGVVVQV